MNPSIRSVSHRSALSKLSLGMGCAASGCTAQARRRAPWLVIGLLVLTTNACAQGPSAQAGVAPDDQAPAPPAVEWQAPLAIASGDADIGPWRMNQSRFHYVDDPAVAVTAAGSAAVVWVDNERKDVFFQRFAPKGRPLLTEPVNVSRSPKIFSWLPKLALAGDNQVFVLWQEIVFSGGSHGGEIFFAHSDDGGRTFSPPQNLSNSKAGDGKGRLTRERWHNGSLDLARADDGSLSAAWTEYEGALWLSRAGDGTRFGAPQRIAGSPARPARAPDLAAGPDASLYLAWTVGEDAAANIHLAVSRDGGRSFGEVRELFADDAHADAPKLAVDDAGAVHVVYARSGTQGQGGPFGPHQIHYARLDAAGNPVIDAKRVSAPEQALEAGANFPYLALAGQSTVIVAWEHYPDFAGRPDGLGIAISRSRGRSFSAAALVPGSTEPGLGFNGSLQGMLMQKLAVGPDGLIHIVNSRVEPGVRSRVRMLRGRLQPR